jgi:hypothetical protein
MLGVAEQGYLPAIYGRLDFVPVPSRVCLPPPLPEHCSSLESEGADVDQLLDDSELELHRLPMPNARYEDLWPFCLTYDGYHRGLRTAGDCFYIAEQVRRNGLQRASLASLRTAAFIYQRNLKWQSSPVEERDLAPIHAVIEELRRRLC